MRSKFVVYFPYLGKSHILPMMYCRGLSPCDYNRFLKIGQEYGTAAAKAIAGLHRHDDVINDVINGVIKFSDKEEIAVKAFIRDPRLSAARLADLIGVKQRQAQRIIASLKKKAGLRRRGARKNGEWYFA